MAVIRRLVPFLLLMMALVIGSSYGVFIFSMLKAARVCGSALISRTVIQLRIDDSFTTVERTLILQGIQELSNVAKCLKLTIAFDCVLFSESLSWRTDAYATIYRSSNPVTWQYHIARFLSGPGSYMGIAMTTTGDMFIMASERGDGAVNFRNTIVHETIHVLLYGGRHSKNKKSLMYHIISGDQKLLPADVFRLKALCIKSD